MAPPLSPAQHRLIRDLLLQPIVLPYTTIAARARCNERTVRRLACNVRRYGNTRPPPSSSLRGCPPRLTSAAANDLLDQLVEDPCMYLDEMAAHIGSRSSVEVSTSTVSRRLQRSRWSRKKVTVVARGRNADLRDFYLYNLFKLQSYQLVFIDESGFDRRDGARRFGWAPVGVTPRRVNQVSRGDRYQLLSSYTQEGTLLSRVYKGTTNGVVYEAYIAQLLQHCERWPAPRSVLVMDNVGFHHSDNITRLCEEAGVKLMYLPPYSPDLNPIEAFFGQVKRLIKRRFREFVESEDQDYGRFVRECSSEVGRDRASAEGHFRHAGIQITYHTP